ncbi:MAG: hypothetical protein GEV05_15145 [Betaproteobacteria bacterium]|nr:hypothetical protein [Betaproteobacteria bacterium]
MSLPIIVIPHPVGNRDQSRILHAGRDIAQECERVLITEAGGLAREFEGKQYPLPRGVMPR